MGEVVVMKRVMSVVMIMVLLLVGCLSFSGCTSQENVTDTDDKNIIQLLHDAGYADAYINTDSEYFENDSDWLEICLYRTDTTEVIWFNEKNCSLRNIKKDSDIVQLLNIMINYYCNENNIGQKILDDIYNDNISAENAGIINYDKFFIGYDLDKSGHIFQVSISPSDTSESDTEESEYKAIDYEIIMQMLKDTGYTDAYMTTKDGKIVGNIIYLNTTDCSEKIWIFNDNFSIEELQKKSNIINLLKIMLDYYFKDGDFAETMVNDMYSKLDENDRNSWRISYEKFDVLFSPDSSETYIESVSVYPHGTFDFSS